MTDIPFNGTVARLHLGAPAGDRVRAQGNFYTDHTVVEINWLPDGVYESTDTKAIVDKTPRIAMEVEVRMNLISSNAPLGKAPVIRYRVEYGHGDSTINMPPQILTGNGPTDDAIAKIGYLLPSRGRVLRLSARQIKVKLFIAGLNDNSVWVTPQALLQVSFNPCSGMQIPISANEESILTIATPDPMAVLQIPLEANEFRIRQENGIAWPAATTTVIFEGVSAYLSAAIDCASYADWTPIPPFAQLIGFGGNIGVRGLFHFRQ